MSRRRLRTLAFWLLPILAARAFLPVGFMLSFQGGALDLAFCPAQVPGIVAPLEGKAATGSAHVHHEHASHDSGTSIEPPCPYGIAALAVPVDVPHLAAGVPPRFDFSSEPTLSFHAGIGPARADRIRGPPLVS